MRVLHVMAGARRRGAGSALSAGVKALSQAGIQQQIVLSADDAAGFEAMADAGLSSDVVGFDRYRREGARAQISRAIARFNPFVVHYWSSRAAYFAPKSAASRSLGWHGGRLGADAFRHCHWHAAGNEEIARFLVANGASEERVGVLAMLPSMSPALPTSRAEFATPEQAPVVLAHTGVSARTGLDTLFQAATNLPGVYVWVVGDGVSEADALSLARRHGVSDRVRLMLRRAHDEAALLAACDLVVFPSRGAHEVALAYAWQAEKPVVQAVDNALARGENEATLPVQWGDAGALRDALSGLLEDASLARRLIERGRRAYETHHTEPAFVRAAMKLYDRIRTAGEKVAAA